jgi:two-component system OmpR family sensor kinase
VFYIDKTALHHRDALFFHVLPTFVVLIAFLGATFFSWVSTVNSVKNQQTERVEQYGLAIVDSLKSRFSTYETVLRSGASVLNFSEDLSREQWSAYVQSVRMNDQMLGVRGIGFAEIVPKEQLEAHIASVRAEGLPAYDVFPKSDQDTHVVIRYLEPFEGVNQAVVGFDMFTETNRRQAMEAASSTGLTVATNAVLLRQDQIDGLNEAGFILYTPLEKNVLKQTTSNQERRGFVYAPFNAREFIQRNVPTPADGYSYSIDNITPEGNDQPLYKESNFDTIATFQDTASIESRIQVAGVTWKVRAEASPSVVPADVRNRPIITLLAGSLFSIIIAGFVYMLLSNRTRVLAEKEQQGIQDAKDELLALASHQLRTPATGVKQYVGMVLDGLAGKLEDTQKTLLQKAYDSNERQLATINEMLFVARADAGQLKMNTQPINMTELIDQILEEHRSGIQERSQELKVSIPDEAIYVEGDRPYLRMAIENLISNASKYTHESGTISVLLAKHDDAIALQIQDTGVGVSKKDQKFLFKKFSRIPNELTSRVSGSGIGLYLTKKVVDAHNGRIIFRSEADKGSEVTILLPNGPKKQPNSLSKRRETYPHPPTP